MTANFTSNRVRSPSKAKISDDLRVPRRIEGEGHDNYDRSALSIL